jgi:hypothetical protein
LCAGILFPPLHLGRRCKFSRNGGLTVCDAVVILWKGGVGRVHLLNSNIQGALLLELYTRDGVGTMISRCILVFFCSLSHVTITMSEM